MKKKRFMTDRYGFDMLFFAVTALCLLVFLLTKTLLWRIPHITPSGIYGVTGLIMIINTSRVFSKKISRREAENIKFTLFLNKLTGKQGKIGDYITDNKGYTPLSQLRKAEPEKPRCKCGQPLVIPEGRGKHIVICPKCGSRNLTEK